MLTAFMGNRGPAASLPEILFSKCELTFTFRELTFTFRELTFTFAICYRPSVCHLSSVTFVHPTQAVPIFSNISTALGTLAIH